jgi:hypothetical protein
VKKKSCRNCKYGEWPLSKNGRRMFSYAGKCTYYVVTPLAPACMREIRLDKTCITPEMGEYCNCFKANQ